MRKNSLLVASTLALAAATSMVPSLAHAACTDAAGRCGDGTGKGLKYVHAQEAFTPGVGFTWQQTTGYGGFGIYGRIRAGLELAFVQYKDPVKGDAYLPLFTVDLAKAPVAATWSAETKTISIKRVDPSEETATFQVNYTLRPQAFAALDTGSSSTGPWTLSQQGDLLYYAYDLTGVVGDVLGNDNFGIHGDGMRKFLPWGFVGLQGFQVSGGAIPAGPLDPNSALFNLPFGFGDDPDTAANDPHTTGSFGVYVQSNPEFSYKTTSVKVGSAELGTTDAIDLPVKSEYGNSVKVPVTVVGAARVDGDVQAKPFLHVQKVFGINIDTTLETGFQQATKAISIPADPTQTLPVAFPTTAEVEIPIPNVKLVKSTIEFTGVAGSEGNGKVTIKNEGDAPAKLTFEPTGDFTISSQGTTISPGSSFDLTVRATPSAAGTVSGNVKIETNDPDSPVLELGVSGTFEDAPPPPSSSSSSGNGGSSGNGNNNDDGSGDGNAAAEDSGCGCKTAGTPVSSPLGVLGGLALGAAALIRRRRKN